jgi:hypothetical protein
MARRVLIPVYCALQEAATQCLKSHSERSVFTTPGMGLLNPMSPFSGRVVTATTALKGDRSQKEAVAYCCRALSLAAAVQAMKQPSSFQAGGSSPGMIASRPQADGRVIGSGSDVGASSPASASSSLDAYFHPSSLGGNSQGHAPLKAAILRFSQRERSSPFWVAVY